MKRANHSKSAARLALSLIFVPVSILIFQNCAPIGSFGAFQNLEAGLGIENLKVVAVENTANKVVDETGVSRDAALDLLDEEEQKPHGEAVMISDDSRSQKVDAWTAFH